jgi:hypothetical protein
VLPRQNIPRRFITLQGTINANETAELDVEMLVGEPEGLLCVTLPVGPEDAPVVTPAVPVIEDELFFIVICAADTVIFIIADALAVLNERQ